MIFFRLNAHLVVHRGTPVLINEWIWILLKFK